MIQPREQSEIHPARGPAIDPGYIRAGTQAHDVAGFDRILIGWHSNGPDGLQVAAYAGTQASRVGFLVAHRPGFLAPSNAARAFATLEPLTGGRAAIHVISGGDDADQARDGDFLGKDARYERTDEYVGILKRLWAADGPVDHDGAYYRLRGASPEPHPAQRSGQHRGIPIYFGGASDAALRVAGRHADVYALWGETQAQVAEIVGRVRGEAAANGRSIRFSLSFRPILAPTEEQAWQRAEAILARTLQTRGEASLGSPARAATPPRWSARRSRSPKRSSTTTRSASPPS